MHYGALALLTSDDAGDPPLLAQDFLDIRVLDVPHTARLEIRKPRIDPHEIRRPIENAIGRPFRWTEDGQHQLHEYVANRARARRACLGGDERARYAVSEELLVRLRALLGADELPPARPFVFREPALLARREDLPDTRTEEREIVGREVGDRSKRQQNIAQQCAGIIWHARKGHRYLERRLSVLSDSHACGWHQVIRH